MKRLSVFLLTIFAAAGAHAQKKVALDSTKPTTVVVTSSFKPSLRPAAKINFSAASSVADTNKPNLFYTIPSQNLFFLYQPTPLQPLALSPDTAFDWKNSNYVKAGYGNFTTPYLRLGLSFGDGKSSVINVHAKYLSSKGQLPFQQFSNMSVVGLGLFSSKNNQNEWSVRAHADLWNQYLYGYKPDSLKFTKDQLKQNFSSFGARIGLRNKVADGPIDYSPSVGIDFFNDNRNANEASLSFALPISKSFGKVFGFSVGLYGDITSLKTPKSSYDNNLYYINPAVQFKTPNVKVNAGFTPSWDNSIFNLLPNFTAEAKIKDQPFMVQLGWIGYYQRNTYQNLARFNPFIAQPDFSSNTRIREQYAGLKGAVGNHFTYNAKVSVLNYNNMALFVNDTTDGKTFNVIMEPSMKNLRIHGELAYTVQEKFSFIAGASWNNYGNLEVNDKAFGLTPLELTGSLRWTVLKDLTVTSDLFFWDGARYRTKAGQSLKQLAAVDMNLGMELGITSKLKGWLQFNNIFNNEYQRWNQYRTLGFSVLAGVVYSFGQTTAK